MSLDKCQKYENLSIEEVLDKLSLLYTNAIDSLRDAIAIYVKDGRIPENAERENGLFAYPELCVTWLGEVDHCEKTRAYARFVKRGNYTVTITQPELFRAYLVEQLSILQQDYDVSFTVRPSKTEIPYPFVIDGSDLVL
ncbi:AMP nucleosidase, partial [Providencia sp. NPDC089923]